LREYAEQYGEGLITGNFIKFLWEIIKILLEYRRRNFHMDVEIKFYPIERGEKDIYLR